MIELPVICSKTTKGMTMISLILFALGLCLGTYIGCRYSRGEHTDEEYTEAVRRWKVARDANGLNYNALRDMAAALGMNTGHMGIFDRDEIVQRVIDDREIINGISRVLHQREMLQSWDKTDEHS